MSRANKGTQIEIHAKVSERSAGTENIQYIQNKLKSMKMSDFVRYLVDIGRRYESGELVGRELKKMLSEIQLTTPIPASTPEPVVPKTSTTHESETSKTVQNTDLINDLLDSIKGLDF